MLLRSKVRSVTNASTRSEICCYCYCSGGDTWVVEVVVAAAALSAIMYYCFWAHVRLFLIYCEQSLFFFFQILLSCHVRAEIFKL
jgi:hypothetical protein